MFSFDGLERSDGGKNVPGLAGFSRTDVEDLLRSGCGALWLTLSETKFLMQAAIVENGKIRSMGSGSDYERMSGEPCPVTCGEKPGYYLKMK